MRSIFVRTFLAMIVSLLVLIIVASTFLFAGVRRSLLEWNMHRNQRIQNLVLPIVSRSFRQQGALDHDSLADSLLPFLAQNQYVYVFEESGRAVFLYRNGEILDTAEISVSGGGQFRGIDGLQPPSALLHADEIVGFLSAGTLGFMGDPANRQFLVSLAWTLVLVVLVAFALATAVAGLLSRRITAQTSAVASGLELLADGHRDVSFPESQASEIRTIAGSASRLQTQLLEEARLRRQWAQDVAHDLRTPVAAVKTQFEAMIEGVIEPTPDRLARVYTEVDRIDDLVQDLRELNSLEAPEQRVLLEPIHAVEFLQTLRLRFEPMLQERALTSDFQAEDLLFTGDDRLLVRAVSNVVHNAVKYADAGGHVEATIREQGLSVVIEVGNTGIVDEETAVHAFDRLYRGENSRGSRGSGLGLSIVRAIVELHHGGVSMEQGGTRTVVRINLPRNRESDR